MSVGLSGALVVTCGRGGGCKDFAFVVLLVLFATCTLASCALRACVLPDEYSLLGIGGVREFTEFKDEAILGRRL